MSFRKEKKFRLTINEFYSMKNLLIENGMTKLYGARKVNSIYFDTLSYDMFSQSEEGVLPRKKIRIRWYEGINRLQLEKKISSVEGRFKTTDKYNLYSNTKEIFKSTLFDKDYGAIHPTLKVSYNREYYMLNKMRITLDSNINYNNITLDPLLDYKDPERVVEIKTAINCSDDFIEKYIPYQVSRFSKYSRGLLISQKNLSEF
ncbi:VTC domain-containing protein [Candidatus Pelagibacter sp. HIMB1321]|uniref:VTC domain-containing protein n=1 Tax=Candidatus Pelagibacter sp. HIMB1321 TaxID=1388755 RepID=UPI000A07FC1A|nr:VTC domain-containing protein [Candidatus Pelagibacter sp. HIMB1321]SMF79485.1 VTC domain-containing protein [Candidatus Pelagibacter sp. HIMB1321]